MRGIGYRLVFRTLRLLAQAERFFETVSYAIRYPKCFFFECDQKEEDTPRWWPAPGGGCIWVRFSRCSRCKQVQVDDLQADE